MDIPTLAALSIALAMDAFAVAVSVGACLVTVNGRQTFRLAFHFGLFQFLMPILGWTAGLSLAMLESGILMPSLVIGLVAAGMTLLGLRIGEKTSVVSSGRMELIGGILLILIGVRIVIEHLK